MTNGGLATTSSKRSPSTGANRSPCSTETLRISLISIVRVAHAVARGFRSEATTRRLCADACRAWTPHPVPRSKALEISRRMVAPANAIVDALTPSTCSVEIEASAGRAKSWTTNQFAGPPSGRIATRLLTSPSPTLSTPPEIHCSTENGASADRASASATGEPRTNSRSRVSSRSPARVARSQGSQFAEREVRERVGTESLREGIEREAALVETFPGPPNGVRTVEEAHGANRARRHRQTSERRSVRS